MKSRATEQFITAADGTRLGVLLDLKTYERLPEAEEELADIQAYDTARPKVLAEREVLLDLAIGMYAAKRLTLGQAAELADVSQGELQRGLGRRQIPVHYDLEDLAHDLQAVGE